MKAISGAASRQFTGAITTLAFIAPISNSKIDVAVLAEIGDALMRSDAERFQPVGDAVGQHIEFGEAGLSSLEFKGDGVAAGLRPRAHHVGKVCRFLRSGHVSPVVIVFVGAILASLRDKDNMGGGAASSQRTQRPYAAYRKRELPCSIRAVVMDPAFAGTTILPPRGAVLFVLRLDRLAGLGSSRRRTSRATDRSCRPSPAPGRRPSRWSRR